MRTRVETIALLALICALFIGVYEVTGRKQEAKEVEIAATQVYDTTGLDIRYAETTGNVRMCGGHYYDTNTIETTDGHLWSVSTDGINEYEFLLVWFDDMGTNEVEDDQIVKIWREVY